MAQKAKQIKKDILTKEEKSFYEEMQLKRSLIGNNNLKFIQMVDPGDPDDVQVKIKMMTALTMGKYVDFDTTTGIITFLEESEE